MESINRIKKKLIDLLYYFRLDIVYYYGNDFASSTKRRKKYAKDFAKVIMNEFSPKSVIDFGCGTGDFLHEFEKQNINITGLDGSKANFKQSLIKKDNFILHDLRDPFRKSGLNKFDCCLCLEVAEHLQEQHSRTLVENLCRSSDIIIFTAAKPGQGGVGHVNLKPSIWWINIFKENNYFYDEDTTKSLVMEMSQIKNIHKWYVDNLFIFKNDV